VFIERSDIIFLYDMKPYIENAETPKSIKAIAVSVTLTVLAILLRFTFSFIDCVRLR
jgi:transcriptional regulator of met regulon